MDLKRLLKAASPDDMASLEALYRELRRQGVGVEEGDPILYQAMFAKYRAEYGEPDGEDGYHHSMVLLTDREVFDFVYGGTGRRSQAYYFRAWQACRYPPTSKPVWMTWLSQQPSAVYDSGYIRSGLKKMREEVFLGLRKVQVKPHRSNHWWLDFKYRACRMRVSATFKSRDSALAFGHKHIEEARSIFEEAVGGGVDWVNGA